MSKYIDAEAVKALIRTEPMTVDTEADRAAVCELIDNLPAADVAEVKHGRWIEEKGKVAKCSVCKKETEADIWGQYWLSPYCPNCGARMDEVEE